MIEIYRYIKWIPKDEDTLNKSTIQTLTAFSVVIFDLFSINPEYIPVSHNTKCIAIITDVCKTKGQAFWLIEWAKFLS